MTFLLPSPSSMLKLPNPKNDQIARQVYVPCVRCKETHVRKSSNNTNGFGLHLIPSKNCPIFLCPLRSLALQIAEKFIQNSVWKKTGLTTVVYPLGPEANCSARESTPFKTKPISLDYNFYVLFLFSTAIMATVSASACRRSIQVLGLNSELKM